jgi:hypothetical protein
VSYIGVVSVVSLYNCVYYCDTCYMRSTSQVGVIRPYVVKPSSNSVFLTYLHTNTQHMCLLYTLYHIYHLPSTIYHLPSTIYHLPSTIYMTYQTGRMTRSDCGLTRASNWSPSLHRRRSPTSSVHCRCVCVCVCVGVTAYCILHTTDHIPHTTY